MRTWGICASPRSVQYKAPRDAYTVRVYIITCVHVYVGLAYRCIQVSSVCIYVMQMSCTCIHECIYTFIMCVCVLHARTLTHVIYVYISILEMLVYISYLCVCIHGMLMYVYTECSKGRVAKKRNQICVAKNKKSNLSLSGLELDWCSLICLLEANNHYQQSHHQCQ